MKKIKFLQYAIATVLLLACVSATQAQQKLKFKVGYNVASPVGSFKDAVSKTSVRGFEAALAYPVNERLEIGLGVLYNDFYQKYPRQVYDIEGGAISAVVSNSIQTLPVLAKVNYSILKEGLIKPYVGLGAGGNIITYKQYLGEFPSGKTAFRPAFQGDAGINIPLGRTRTAGLNLGANFNYLPFNYNGIDQLNNWGAHAGVFFNLR